MRKEYPCIPHCVPRHRVESSCPCLVGVLHSGCRCSLWGSRSIATCLAPAAAAPTTTAAASATPPASPTTLAASGGRTVLTGSALFTASASAPSPRATTAAAAPIRDTPRRALGRSAGGAGHIKCLGPLIAAVLSVLHWLCLRACVCVCVFCVRRSGQTLLASGTPKAWRLHKGRAPQW